MHCQEFGLTKRIKSLFDACNKAEKLLDASGGLSGPPTVQDKPEYEQLLTALRVLLEKNQALVVGNAAKSSDFERLVIETKVLSDATTKLVIQNEAHANVLDRPLWQLFRAWLARRFTK